jgi:hypothetical protein
MIGTIGTIGTMVCDALLLSMLPAMPTARQMSCSCDEQSSTRMCRKSATVAGRVGVIAGVSK